MKEVLKLHRENQFSQAGLNYNCTIIKTFMENANLTPTAGFLLSLFPLIEMFPSKHSVCVKERERGGGRDDYYCFCSLINVAPFFFPVRPNIFSPLDKNPSGTIS